MDGSIIYKMLPKEEEQRIPTLLFLLEHNKISEIVKAMLNENLSCTLLSEYSSASLNKSQASYVTPRKKQREEKYEGITGLSDLLEVKGSTKDKPREYHDENLKKSLRKRIKGQCKHLDQEVRKKLWLQFTEIHHKPGFYQSLKELDLAIDFQISIEKDILRTQVSPQIRARTEEVLRMFAIYNPYIGYCQGMNNIVAFLIGEQFTLEETFFLLKRVTEDILPLDYYIKMDSVMAYLRVLYEIIHIKSPKLFHHLKKLAHQIEGNHTTVLSFVFTWFICLFCNGKKFPTNIIRMIWDHFLLEGVTILFKSSLVMLEILEPRILACREYQDLIAMERSYQVPQDSQCQITRNLDSIYINESILFLLKEKIVEEANEERTRKEVLMKPGSKAKKGPRVMTDKCDANWNVCLQMLENNSHFNNTFQNFVFKAEREVTVIPGYLENQHKQEREERARNLSRSKICSENKSICKKLMVGRIPHICRPPSDSLTEDSNQDEQLSRNKMMKEISSESDSTERRENLIADRITHILQIRLNSQEISEEDFSETSKEEREEDERRREEDERRREEDERRREEDERRREEDERRRERRKEREESEFGLQRLSNVNDLMEEYELDEMFERQQ